VYFCAKYTVFVTVSSLPQLFISSRKQNRGFILAFRALLGISRLERQKIAKDAVQKSKCTANIKAKSHSLKQKPAAAMPIIKCACGTRILVVPDLAAMNQAIENHVAKHTDPNQHSQIRKHLIEQTLKKQVEQIPEFKPGSRHEVSCNFYLVSQIVK